MNKLFRFIILIAGLSMTFAGCTSDFDDMNTDPNNPTPGSVDPKYQLLYMQARGIPYRDNWQQISELMISTFCEYSANDGLSASDYSIDARYVEGLWDITYTVIANANSVIKANEDNPIYNNVVQMARIWKAYVILRLTDCIGDVPYSEAANDIDQPRYDTQEEIYYTVFEELKDAVSKLDESATNNIGTYDLIYNGDAAMWKKFANSLRLRMAVRISDVDPSKAKTEASEAISAGVFTCDDDAAMMTQGGGDNYAQNPIYYHRNSTVLHMSTAYYKIVCGLGGFAWPTAKDQAVNSNITDEILSVPDGLHPDTVDPRAPIQFEPSGVVAVVTTESLDHNWNGTDPGHVTSAVGASMDNGQFVNDYAKIGPWYYETETRPYPLFKFSELCFLKAIAIEKGLTSGSAQTEYEAGVRSSMEELGIPSDTITKYLSSTAANEYGTSPSYTDNSGSNNSALDKILTQKYIAQFEECCFQTWADHRQFHKPTLMPFANVSSSVFTMSESDRTNNTPAAYIKRLYYPSSEYTVNEANVTEAVNRMGGSNSIQNNVWWDVD